MAQFLRPDSDITTTEINTGTFADIDESSVDNSDYISTNDNALATYECGLSSAVDPVSSSNHICRFTIAKADTGVAPASGGNVQEVSVYLYEGATLIATLTLDQVVDTVFTQETYILTGPEADSITDYSNLRMRFIANNSGGGAGANRRGGAIGWFELEVPDAPSSQKVYIIQ